MIETVDKKIGKVCWWKNDAELASTISDLLQGIAVAVAILLGYCR
jgi:hypothetical protein